MDKMTTSEMQELYKVEEFVFYMCVVTRKSDNIRGTLEFDHSPRFYYNFVPLSSVDEPMEIYAIDLTEKSGDRNKLYKLTKEGGE